MEILIGKITNWTSTIIQLLPKFCMGTRIFFISFLIIKSYLFYIFFIFIIIVIIFYTFYYKKNYNFQIPFFNNLYEKHKIKQNSRNNNVKTNKNHERMLIKDWVKTTILFLVFTI